jgi:apolipoprotein N-acyltransferase
MSRQAVAPTALGVVVGACALVAAATGRPVWAAVAGAGLALVFWGLECLSWRRARQASFNGAVAVALGGMALRLAVVVGALVVIGVLDRAAFATAAVSFLAGFTVYTGLRLFLFVGDDTGGREVRVP